MQYRPLPESTYRLQFHAGFTFRDAAAVVPYLHELGVTHVYASPYLKARPGSTHGYDVIDHCSLNPELGTAADYDAWLNAMRAAGMSHILDIVPNHVGVGTNDNVWWNDVLEHGPTSRYAGYFDIAWRGSPRPELHDKVLLPVLGKLYWEALEAGELKLVTEEGKVRVAYYDRRFPLRPESAAEVEARGVDAFNGTPGEPHTFDALHELLERQYYRLSYWRVASDEINYRRFFDINDLAALSMEREEVFRDTHRLILRLVAERKVDGLRIDHPDGLYDPKQYFERLEDACANARRPTGANGATPPLPSAGEAGGEGGALAAGWRDLADQVQILPPHPDPLPQGERENAAVYLVAEKILAPDEPLPEDWPVHGTTGYDFLNHVTGLFIDSAHEHAFDALYERIVGYVFAFAQRVQLGKRLILETSLASELQMLAHRLDRFAQKHRRSRDFTLRGLRDALRDVIVHFPVYRSYVDREGVHELDREYVRAAVERATHRRSKDSAVIHFISDVVLQQYAGATSETDRAEQLEIARKFQQLTAPAMAKGVEDTAFYLFNRFVSLNEVGGDPSRFGVPPEKLHKYLTDRQSRWPHSLSPLSTHDTKRSEDVRARLNVLSEMPEEWAQVVLRWNKHNGRHVRESDTSRTVPSANDQYLIYQTLIGAWPLEPYTPDEFATFVGRVQAYMEKVMREQKDRTSWTDPNVEYEGAVKEFIARILYNPVSPELFGEIRRLQRTVSDHGLLNSLAQTVLKFTAPGVPDTYQGTELWDFSLVDPDNRRPVDYERRRRMLVELNARGEPSPALARELLESKEDGRIKLFVTWRLLHARRDNPGLFSAGEYIPLKAAGERRDHVFSFARRGGGRVVIVAVSRLTRSLPRSGDTHLQLSEVAADGRARLRNLLTGECHTLTPDLRIADLFATLPFAVLLSE